MFIRAAEATHLCPIAIGAGGLIESTWCIDSFAETLVALPPDLNEADILLPELKLWSQRDLSLFYVPFERVNPDAKIMLVGLTPGRHQLWRGTLAAAEVLRRGGTIEEALTAAWSSGSFAGTMRKNLIAMLDDIGVADWLGVPTTRYVYTPEFAHLEGSTSALLHPVFVAERNYGGNQPSIEQVPILSAFVDQVLAADLAFVPDALVVPLGKAVGRALTRLIEAGQLNPGRVLLGLPHPSGANGHRKAQFATNRASLVAQVSEWATT